MKQKKSKTPKRDPKQEAYDMLDKPVMNPRYGGVTMREALMRGVQRSDGENQKLKSNDDELQFEL